MQFLEMSSLIEVCVLAVIIALTSQLVSDVDGFCAPDTGTITGADGICFYFGRNRLNWTDADAECKRRLENTCLSLYSLPLTLILKEIEYTLVEWSTYKRQWSMDFGYEKTVS